MTIKEFFEKIKNLFKKRDVKLLPETIQGKEIIIPQKAEFIDNLKNKDIKDNDISEMDKEKLEKEIEIEKETDTESEEELDINR